MLLGALVLIQLVVVFHELGHLLAARLFRVPVREFLLGLGKPLIAASVGGLKVSLRLLPVGGGLDIDDGAFNGLPAWKRVAILTAGPLANLASAWLAVSLASAAVAVSAGAAAGELIWALWHGTGSGARLVLSSVSTTVLALVAIVAGSDSVVVGPVGLLAEVGRMPLSPVNWLAVFVAVSAGVAVFNLLPLPPLDGGRVVVAAGSGLFPGGARRLEKLGTVILVLFLVALTAGDIVVLVLKAGY